MNKLFFINFLMLFCLSACQNQKIERQDLVLFHQKNISPYFASFQEIKTWQVHIDSHYSMLEFWENLPFLAEDICSYFLNHNSKFWANNQRINWQIFKNKLSCDSTYYLKNVIEQICSQKQPTAIITAFEFFDENRTFKAITHQGDSVWTNLNPYPWANFAFKKWFDAGNYVEIKPLEGKKKAYLLLFIPENHKISPELRRLLGTSFCFSKKIITYKNYDKYKGGSSQSIDFEALNDKIDYYLFKKSDIEGKSLIGNNFLHLSNISKNISLRTTTTNYTKSYFFYQKHKEQNTGAFRIDTQTGDTLFFPSDLGFHFLGGTPDSVFEANLDSTQQEICINWVKNRDIVLEKDKKNLFLLQIYAKDIEFYWHDYLAKDLQHFHQRGFKVESLYRSLVMALPKKLETGLIHSYYLHILE